MTASESGSPPVEATRERNLRPQASGGFAVLLGLLVLAITSYGVLIVAGRALGAARFSGVSALYVLLSAIGTGLFLSAEQEVARLWAVCRLRGTDPLATAVRVAILAFGLGATVALIAETWARHLALQLLAGDPRLLAELLAGLLGYAVCFSIRGGLAGTRRLSRYGMQLAVEGTSRLLGCIPLAALGAGADAFGFAIAASPWIAAGATAPWRSLRRPAPAAISWLQLSRGLGFLVVSIGASQVLINAGPVVVEVLAGPGGRASAGGFLAALVVVRIPVFLFTAVQPSFLPAMSAHAEAGREREFSRMIRLTTLSVAGFAAVMAVAMAAVGPLILRLAFGFSAGIGRLDFGLLSVASGLFLLATLWAQALLAAGRHRATVAGWGAGLLALALATAAPGDAVGRAESGFIAGAAVAALVQAAVLWRGRARPPTALSSRVVPGVDVPGYGL